MVFAWSGGGFVALNFQQKALGVAEARRFFQGLQEMAFGAFRPAAGVEKAGQFIMRLRRISRVQQQQMAVSANGNLCFSGGDTRLCQSAVRG